MNKSQIRDIIDNEFKRIKIQKHPNYAGWYSSLSTYAQLVVESVLEEDISPDVISFAQDSPSDELEDYEFLRVIADSNPGPGKMIGLTNTALEYILYDLIDF
jgi:hypothetical protein